MPELPEVETARRSLARLVVGRRIERLTVHRPEALRSHSAAAASRLLVGRTFIGMSRRGKALLFELDAGLTLVFHFSLWGLILVKRVPIGDGQTAVTVALHDGRTLEFRELQLSSLNLYRRADLGTVPYLAALGIDPLDRSLTLERFRKLLDGRGAVRNLLTDQRRLAGIGNLWALEILFAAKIHPGRGAATLDDRGWQRLYGATRSVLQRGIRAGGEPEFQDAAGRPGRFRLAVYGREGRPCRICGGAIRSGKVGGRPTFYCPKCQK